MTDLALLSEPFVPPAVYGNTLLHEALSFVVTCCVYAGLGILSLGAYCVTAY